MKALTVAQPWASLIVAGVKTIETRPSPPNGPMRPDGVRGLPGLAIERGERIAIHAAARRPKVPSYYGPWCVDEHPAYGLYVDEHDGLGRELTLSLGAIVGTVVVADALPIVDAGTPVGRDPHILESGTHPPHHLLICRPAETISTTGFRVDPVPTWKTTKVDAQRPLGDFTGGRWGWLLTDPKPTTVECPSDCARFDGQWPGWMLGSNWDWVPCPVCAGAKRCDPVPVRGRQGVWEWTP